MLIAKYTCNASGIVPIFNSGYVYEVNETESEGIYTVEITSENDFSSCSFSGKSQFLTVEYLKVTSNVTNMKEMFNGCTNLTSLDVSNFDTKNVTNMGSMFFNCINLTTLDVSNFNTSNVTYMTNMFRDCNKLTSLDLSNFDTSKVTIMQSMFQGCTNLTQLDVSNFNTSNVTNMFQMFYNCNNLTSLDVSNWDTSKVNNMSAMFNNCNNLTSLNVSNFDTSNVIYMDYMFSNCNNLTSLDVSNFNTTNVINMGYMFSSCNNLTTLNVSNFNTSEVIVMSYMFSNCQSLTSLDLSNFNTSKVTNMSYMFYYCTNLTSLDVSNFNTSNVTSMGYMFRDCNTLTSLDLSNFNTSNVTNMRDMFCGCNNLTSLDVSNFNTSKVDNMQGMFYGCTNLTSLDVSNFDTSNVTTVQGMFMGCQSLTSLDLSNFDTSNVTSMYQMFYNCNNLTSLGLIYTNIDTINQLQTPSTATLYIDTNIDQTAYTGSSKLEVYEQRTVTINIPTALRSNEEIADRIYWNDTDKHYYIEQNINPNTNETLETPNIIASGVKQPIYLKTYENMLSVGISNIDASYMSINVPFFEIPTDYEYKWEDELDYIKQSFELRYPDEDDVPNGWGFMGCEIAGKCIDYWIDSNNKLTTTYFSYTESNIMVRGAEVSYITCFCDSTYLGSASGSDGIYTLIDTTNKINITFTTSTIDSFRINDELYTIGEIVNVNRTKEPYDTTIFDASYGLKALIDWVDNCTDEEFVADFDKHFLKDYMLRYYCLVILIGAVDNLGGQYSCRV